MGKPSVKGCVCSPDTLSTEGFFETRLGKLNVLRFCRTSEKLADSEVRFELADPWTMYVEPTFMFWRPIFEQNARTKSRGRRHGSENLS